MSYCTLADVQAANPKRTYGATTTPTLAEVGEFVSQIAGEIEDLLSPPVPCDVRVLNGAPVEFQYEVIRAGRIVFCRNEEQKIDYETDMMRRYLDLKYLFDRVDQAFLAGVSR